MRGDRPLGGGEVGQLLAVEHLLLEVAQKASILPFVQGVSIWVRMCRIDSSSRLRWKRWE
jgi:hypothetical protein